MKEIKRGGMEMMNGRSRSHVAYSSRRTGRRREEGGGLWAWSDGEIGDREGGGREKGCVSWVPGLLVPGRRGGDRGGIEAREYGWWHREDPFYRKVRIRGWVPGGWRG